MKVIFLLLVFGFLLGSAVSDTEYSDVDDKVYWNSGQTEPAMPSIMMPPQGVLGVDKLYTPYAWPVPAVSPTGITSLYILSNTTCSTNSAFRGTYFNCSIQYPFTCNGLQNYILPSYSMVALDGFIQPLVVPRLHQNNVYVNGNYIQLAAGVITTPPKCAGGIVFEVVIYLANSQYQCVTTGVNGHKIIYQLKLITGNCQSTCWLYSGNTLLSPPVNNLGAVVEPTAEGLPMAEQSLPAPEPYPQKPQTPAPTQPTPPPSTEKPYAEMPYPPMPYPKPPPMSYPQQPPYSEKPYNPPPPPPPSYAEKPYNPPPPPPPSYAEKPYNPPPPPPPSYAEKPYNPPQQPPAYNPPPPPPAYNPPPPPQQAYPPPQSYPQLPGPSAYHDKPYLQPPQLPYAEKPYPAPQQHYPAPPQQQYPEKPHQQNYPPHPGPYGQPHSLEYPSQFPELPNSEQGQGFPPSGYPGYNPGQNHLYEKSRGKYEGESYPDLFGGSSYPEQLFPDIPDNNYP